MVERLRGLDAAFLALETPATPLHVTATLVFEGPGLDFPTLRRTVVERHHLVPAWHRRPVPVPFGLEHPLWVEEPELELDDHLRRASLPSPGGPAELAELVGERLAQPLVADRPLWDLTLVEGLEGGHVAVIGRVHHAAIDGVGGAEALAALFDVEPASSRGPESQAEVVPPAGPDSQGDAEAAGAAPGAQGSTPRPEDLLRHAVGALGRQPERLLSTVVRSVGAALGVAERQRRLREEDQVEPPPLPFRAPRTSLNGTVSPERRYAMVELSLEDVRAVREGWGGTVNEVVLAVVSGALRRLLGDRGEEPAASLTAAVPVSTRRGAPGPPGSPANRVTAMLVSLATTVDDVEERYFRVCDGSRLAKGQLDLVPEELLRAWSELAVPAVSTRLARLAGNLGVFDRLPPFANVVVSSVRGSPQPLWCSGSRLVSLYPAGPLAAGVGLNVTAVSYQSSLAVGVVGCRRLVPEVGAVAGHLADSLAELVKASARHRRRKVGEP